MRLGVRVCAFGFGFAFVCACVRWFVCVSVHACMCLNAQKLLCWRTSSVLVYYYRVDCGRGILVSWLCIMYVSLSTIVHH